MMIHFVPVRSPKSLYKLEAHLTHNFNPHLGVYRWYHTYGGETETDGQKGDNEQRSLNMGATLGVQFSKSLGVVELRHDHRSQ